jgi:hypothetical protein
MSRTPVHAAGLPAARDDARTGRAPGGPSRAWWVVLALAGLFVAASAVVWSSPALIEAWLLVFLVMAGLGSASLGLLMIGHLLGDAWLRPIRDELEPATWTLPLLVVVAIPLAVNLEHLYPWAAEEPADLAAVRRAYFTEGWVLARGAIYLVVWSALAGIITQAGPHRIASGIGLALLGATFSLATIDWLLSREPVWWSSLAPFSLAVSHLLAALALAILVTAIRQGHPEREPLVSLEWVLLTLVLLSLWVWFSQYLVVWMANLPEEAGWILRRHDLPWMFSPAAFLSVLVVAGLLLMPTRARRWRVFVACGLVLLHHQAHMVWFVWPIRIEGLQLSDAVLLAAIVAVAALWFGLGLRRHPDVVAKSGAADSAG